MKKALILISGSCFAFATTLGLGPVSTFINTALDTPTVAVSRALPGQCAVGYGPLGNGGGFCDTDPWPDGSFMHWERVCVLGFCGENSFRACHVPGGRVPTDYDPRTRC